MVLVFQDQRPRLLAPLNFKGEIYIFSMFKKSSLLSQRDGTIG